MEMIWKTLTMKATWHSPRSLFVLQERKEEILWQKPLHPQKKHKKATKNFDYTTIVDRLRTVSWGNDSHPIDVVKPVYGIPTFQLIAKAV